MNDVLVVGGGPAGAAFAHHLAAAGRQVTLVERDTAPREKICGEFLSHEALACLRRIGLDLPALGALPIDRVAMVDARGIVAQATLPFPAMSLSRRSLDAALLGRAASAGVELRTSQAVRALEPAPAGWHARLDGGECLDARNAALATGKHELRGWSRGPGRQNDLVGFKQLFTLEPSQQASLAGAVELLLFRGGYAGLQPIEGGRANLCLLIRRSRLAEIGDWQHLLAALRAELPHLDRRLAGATPILARPLSIAGLPYGLVTPPRPGAPWRLGDQAAVIPSFSGDGISIALHSAERAAAALLAGHSAETYQRNLAIELRHQLGRATLLSRLLVLPFPQHVIAALCRLHPGLLAAVARTTRIRRGDAGALERSGVSLPCTMSA